MKKWATQRTVSSKCEMGRSGCILKKNIHGAAFLQDNHRECGHIMSEGCEAKALVDHLQREAGTDYIL